MSTKLLFLSILFRGSWLKEQQKPESVGVKLNTSWHGMVTPFQLQKVFKNCWLVT